MYQNLLQTYLKVLEEKKKYSIHDFDFSNYHHLPICSEKKSQILNTLHRLSSIFSCIHLYIVNVPS